MIDKHRTIRLCCLSLAMICVLGACSSPPTQLDKILDRGVLRIATRMGPTTYYIDSDGESGMEYEMARMFAEDLGVDLELVIARNTSETITALQLGQADIAAAALSRYFAGDESLVFGPSYQWVTPQLVYHSSSKRPSTPGDIFPYQLHFADGTISTERLEELKLEYPNFSWYVHQFRSNADMLEMLRAGEISYTVLYSNEVQKTRLFTPEIRAAFNLSDPRPLAWAIRDTGDNSLLEAINRFHQRITDSGELAELIEYFYGYTQYFDYVDSRRFVDRFRERLPEYLPFFKAAAGEHGFNWRFLAAVSYQESHWNRRARSPTGVRGLMMLTRIAARRVGIENRMDPESSIHGGASYLRELIDRIPGRIPEPDRTWLGLAAYNVGMGHLEDARIITEIRGGNPDLWEDVKASLPLLSREVWYQRTRNGYARGLEPVRYVENIRKYHRILVQLTQPDFKSVKQNTSKPLLVNAPAL